MLKIILISIFAISCGIETEKIPLTSVNKDFGKYSTYVEHFLEIASQAGIDTKNLKSNRLTLITSFEDNKLEGLDKLAVGACFTGEYNTIKIKKSFEEISTVPSLKWVLFHEMGHCIFNAKHSVDVESLMTPYLPLEVYLAKDTSDLVEQKAEQFMQDYLNEPAAPLVINR